VIATPEIVDPIPVGAPVPELKYPEKFLPQDSKTAMSTPETKGTGSPSAPALTTMPVEKLIDSQKPEKPLVIDGDFSANSK